MELTHRKQSLIWLNTQTPNCYANLYSRDFYSNVKSSLIASHNFLLITRDKFTFHHKQQTFPAIFFVSIPPHYYKREIFKLE